MARIDRDVVVIGSGPNGLAAAVTLARAGLRVRVLEAQPSIGGGARTLPADFSSRLAPGLVHDVCSAVHPLALASPFLRGFDLAARGVRLDAPAVSYAHPLDGPGGQRAGLAFRDLHRTVESLGPRAGVAWRRLFGPLVEHADDVARLALVDRRSLAAGLDGTQAATAARLAVAALVNGTRAGSCLDAWSPGGLSRGADADLAQAMLAGVAAHAIAPLPSVMGAGTALLLGTLAHTGGWPVPRGGSQAIADSLVADLVAHGGEIVPGREVTGVRDLPPARAYVLDTGARAAARILGDRLPSRVRGALERFRHGNAAAKVDLVLDGPVPWAVPEVGRAATVHVGGSFAELARAEAEVAAGRHAARPVVLLSDPTVGDPERARAGLRPLWTYAHVPAGSTRDVTEQVLAQIERFAPGVRDVVVAARCTPAARMAEHDANHAGGDIAAGAITPWQMLARPRLALDPYHLRAGAYLCSAATPPGPGVHGMGGWNAARSVLAREFGIRTPPSLSP